MGIFSKASKVIKDGTADIDKGRRNRPKDEVKAKRDQKQGRGK